MTLFSSLAGVAAPVSLRPNKDAEALHVLAKCLSEPDQTGRLLVLSATYADGSRSEAPAHGGFKLQAMRDWVLAFNGDMRDGFIGDKIHATCVRLNPDHRGTLEG